MKAVFNTIDHGPPPVDLMGTGGWDEIDDDQIEVDPYFPDPPTHRKDEELSRTLAILDELDNEGSDHER